MWKSFFKISLLALNVALILGVLALLDGCATKPAKWQGRFWEGRHKELAIARTQEGAHILCEDPQFDDYICVRQDELESLINELLKKQVR